jgi:hypothetical protein
MAKEETQLEEHYVSIVIKKQKHMEEYGGNCGNTKNKHRTN